MEAGDYHEQYVQILSGVEADAIVFLRYQNAAPSGGDTTSDGDGEEEGMSGFPGGEMPDFGDMGGMPDFGSGGGGSMPSFGGGGGGMPSGMGMR